jgi:hypothetical protein
MSTRAKTKITKQIGVGVLVFGTMVSSSRANPGDQIAKLLPIDGAAGHFFGASVAVGDSLILIGATRDSFNGINSGSAYIFDKTTRQQITKLLPIDGSETSKFGNSVDIGGLPEQPVAVVGAFLDNSAYIFDITDPANPVQAAKLTGDGTGGKFGYNLAVDGTTAIISAYWNGVNGSNSGKVYIFDISDPYNPVQRSILFPANGAADDQFGNVVRLNGFIALVGAWTSDRNGTDSGSVYLFDISDLSNPVQLSELVPADGSAGDLFGNSVAISTLSGNQIAVVGCLKDDDFGGDSGSIYRFDISDPANPHQIDKIYPNDPEPGNWFGVTVAMSNTRIIVGSNFDNDNGIHSGSAYVFDSTTGTQVAKILPVDGAAADQFGTALAISGDTAIVSNVMDDDMGTDSGSAYLFTTAPCLADLTGDGELDFFDVSVFLTFFSLNHPDADWNSDGLFDFFDVIAFLADYSAGCP